MPFFYNFKIASSGIPACFLPWMLEGLIDRYSGVDHEYVSEKSLEVFCSELLTFLFCIT